MLALSESSSAVKKRRPWRFFIVLAAVAVFLLLLNLFLQSVWAHRTVRFVPDYAKEDLAPLWEKAALSDDDYDLLFRQTGLSRSSVDALLAYGQAGQARIEEIQDGFFTDYPVECLTLIGGRFTCEDLLVDEDGSRLSSVPLAPLQDGDIIVAFSTHTFGWRHGHAGLVVDAESGITLEAVMMFSDSARQSVYHWPTYSNFIVLRVKDADEQTRQDVADFALTYLDQIPYRLTSGIFGDKAPDPQSGTLGAQCAYLPWYAWQAFGYDLDGDGGKIVTVLDLAQSPLVEVVQFCGVDPEPFLAE